MKHLIILLLACVFIGGCGVKNCPIGYEIGFDGSCMIKIPPFVQEPTVKIPYKKGTAQHFDLCWLNDNKKYDGCPKELPLQEALQLIVNNLNLKYVPATEQKTEAYLTK